MAGALIPLESIRCPHCQSGTAVNFVTALKDIDSTSKMTGTSYTVGT